MKKFKTIRTDLLIIGSGIAGLRAGLLAGARLNVCLITKGQIRDTGTGQAQGGIAAALDEKDSPAAHLKDTLSAGAGLCDKKAVEVLVKDGVRRVKELIDWGCQFDRGPGGLAFALEAAHRHRRILHAGDATGAEIEKTLGQKILKVPKVKIIENSCGLSLIVKNNRCLGALVLNTKTGEVSAIMAPATLLSTGGLGQIFSATTNPAVATGDGLAMAWRAGAELSDLEFIQFHPTTLDPTKLGETRKSLSVFLISEAVRGEGAVLKNIWGERFMPDYHALAELAPRDVVARAIVAEMKKTKSSHVLLDISHVDSEYVRNRFPMIYSRLLELDLDITKDQIPVAPAAHYFMGGVKTDINGRTSIPGLYAAGEIADVGVHGANRLASNSLLDGLVFGYRAAQAVLRQASKNKKGAARVPSVSSDDISRLVFKTRNSFRPARTRQQIRETMWEKVGIIRDEVGLSGAEKYFSELCRRIKLNYYSQAEMELANMALCGWLISRSARHRVESRGGHYRRDFPKTDDRRWMKHVTWQSGKTYPVYQK
jgi:L-aspartate oxidase